MVDTVSQSLDSMADYRTALDQLCGLAQQELCLFEKNYDGLGFDSVARYDILRHFLINDPARRLHVLVHDQHYLATRCPRMTMLLEQFSHAMFIYQTPPHLQHLSEGFAVADTNHYVRRFHFDYPRGIFAQHDPINARVYQGKFKEMWESSHPAIAPTRLGL